MPTIGAIVADDLTGAGDTGVQFAGANLQTRLLFGEPDTSDGTDVLVFNTDSRAVAAQEAYQRVYAAVTSAHHLGVRNIYKKIDSTLRGNLGAEIDAVLDVMSDAYALLCPAFPANGRIVAGGHLLVQGQPVSRTATARDPVNPVRESYIPALLHNQTGRAVGHLDLSYVVEGVEPTGERLQALLAEGDTIIVADAVSEGDLACLVEAVQRQRRPCVLTGSAGLANPTAIWWARQLQPEQVEQAHVLVVVGSVNAAAREQTYVLVNEHGWPAVQLDIDAAFADEDTWNRWLHQQRPRLAEAAATATGIVLATPAEAGDVEQVHRLRRERGMNIEEAARRLVARLASLTQLAIERLPIAGLVLTGGDTATAVLRAVAATGFNLIDEVAPGVPVGRLVGGQIGNALIVTKAGGFGGRETLWQAGQYLGKQTRLSR